MVQASSSTPPEFVVNLGDSFYWCGVQSVQDYQIGVDFEEPYSDASLQVRNGTTQLRATLWLAGSIQANTSV
jgi:hypothetical protein